MRLIFVIILSSLFFSCKDELDGACSLPFKIDVSNPILEDGKNIYIINIKNKTGWWLNSVVVNGQNLPLVSADLKTGNYFLIEKELFVFEKISNTQAKVFVKNPNQVDKIVFDLQAANCFGSFLLE